jgi:membrane protein involved in colicin uptake
MNINSPDPANGETNGPIVSGTNGPMGKAKEDPAAKEAKKATEAAAKLEKKAKEAADKAAKKEAEAAAKTAKSAATKASDPAIDDLYSKGKGALKAKVWHEATEIFGQVVAQAAALAPAGEFDDPPQPSVEPETEEV